MVASSTSRSREIVQDFHTGAGVFHDAHEIRSGHLLLDELLRRCKRAQLIRNGHGCHVEIHGQQAMIFVFGGAGSLTRNLIGRERFHFGLRGRRADGGVRIGTSGRQRHGLGGRLSSCWYSKKRMVSACRLR